MSETEGKEKEHLPFYGPGPFYGAVVIGLTVLAVVSRNASIFRSGKIEVLHMPMLVLGVLLIAAGIALWIYAVPVTKIDDGIRDNRLVTNGAYALVRNPIYSAIMIACTGVLLIVGNLWFIILPLFFWIFMTVLMKATEEKWLKELYGPEYEDYCRRVNRCWPWPSGKQ